MKKYTKIFALLLVLVLGLGLSFAPQALVQAEEAAPGNQFENFFSNFVNPARIEQAQAIYSQPFGFDSQVKFQLGEGLVMGASEMALLEKFQYNLKIMTNPVAEGTPQVAMEFLLSNPETPDSALSFNMYTLEDKAIIDLPGLLDKPILTTGSVISDFESSVSGQDMSVTDLSAMVSMPSKGMMAWQSFMASFEDQGIEVRTLTVGEFSEDLNASLKFMPAEKLNPALQELLQELKIEEYMASDMDEEMEAYGQELGVPASLGFNEELSYMIEDLKEGNQNNDAYLAVLADDNGIQRGYQMRLVNRDNGEAMSVDAYYLVDAENQVAPFVLSVSEENAEGIVPLLQLNGQASGDNTQGYNADFVLSVLDDESGEISTPIEGQLTNLTSNNAENVLEEEMAFDLALTIRGYDSKMVYIDPDTGEKVDPFGMENEEFTEEESEETPDDEFPLEDESFETIDLDKYDIDFEKVETLINMNITAKVQGTNSTVDFNIVPDANIPSQSITFNVVTDLIFGNDQISIPNSLPQDYYDIDKPEDADALSNNEDFQNKLFSLLSELGLMGEY
ncbi:MAG: hypothetical protein Q4E09_00685 [Eubacteriales bacterium]|nr:hypothetical protein [Eubacteriales bacterium]